MDERDITASLKPNARSSSSPLLVMTPPDDDDDSSPSASPIPMRRPSCVDGVVPLAIVRPKRRLRNHAASCDVDIRVEGADEKSREPPKILETDFDKENENKQ